MASAQDTEFAIVIPAYNEAATIRDIVSRALKFCKIVIVVDDGSTDTSVDVLNDMDITFLQHTQNCGKAASLLHGIQTAISQGAQSVITLDGDGQHRPEDIPRLLNCAAENPNTIIVGSRLANKAAIPAKRYYANKIANFWLSWVAGYSIEDSQSGFRIYPVSLFDGLEISTRHGFVFESEILIHAAKRHIYSTPVPIDAIYSVNARASHFRGVADITLISVMVAKELFSHGMAPLRFYRAFIKPLIQKTPQHETTSIAADKAPGPANAQLRLSGISMLLLSFIIIIFTAGLSLLPSLLYVFITAKTASNLCPTEGMRVVLGQQLVNDKPTNSYITRLNRAHTCLLDSAQTKVLILGGITADATVSEATAGRNWLIANGIAQDRILVEEKSRNTLENLKHAQKILAKETQPVVLISHRYHLARATILASGFSIKNVVCAADESFHLTISSFTHLFKEALYLHWYFTGRTFSRLTNNKKMLARIE